MPNRSRKEQVRYTKKQKKEPPSKVCPFCSLDREPENIVETSGNFIVVRPAAKYRYWDEQDVADHLMLVPKLHTESLKNLPAEAGAEFLELLGKYEAEGYSVYARTPAANSKTVPHQHTHLIKVQGKSKKFMLHLKKPYILIMR
jgi:diadenosine tetraphosphate (Ap4A) HIT family hydrolase